MSYNPLCHIEILLPLRIACSWYEELDLDALHSLHRDAPTDKDPVLTAKRKDRAYRIAEFAHIGTFIPPPPDVRDALSDDEEEDVDEEDEEAGEGDAPPQLPKLARSPLLLRYSHSTPVVSVG
jgi:hypothetical protein